MQPKKRPDFQTVSIFLVLALLTLGFVTLLKLVLIAPTPINFQQVEINKPADR